MSSHISPSSAPTAGALLDAPDPEIASEFRSRTIIISRPEDVYQRWVYYRTEDHSGVAHVDDVILAPLLNDEMNATRYALWLKPSRGADRKMRASVGTQIELASPHHVQQWIDERLAATLRDSRTSYAGVPAVTFLVGVVLGAIFDNLVGSGLALTATLGGLAAVAAVVQASNHDARVKQQTTTAVRGKYGQQAIAHLAVLNLLAEAEAEAKRAEEVAAAAEEPTEPPQPEEGEAVPADAIGSGADHDTKESEPA